MLVGALLSENIIKCEFGEGVRDCEMIRRDAPEPASTAHCYDEVVTDELWDLLHPGRTRGLKPVKTRRVLHYIQGFAGPGLGENASSFLDCSRRSFNEGSGPVARARTRPRTTPNTEFKTVVSNRAETNRTPHPCRG